MKTISLFLFSVLLLPSYLLHAEDIRLANGRVLRNVTVNRIASDGVIVSPQGFGATGTIYYWRYLHPEDAAKFQAQREKEGRQAAAVAQIEETSVVRAIKVTQVKDDGVLAQIAPAHMVEGNNNLVPNKASEPKFFRDGDWQDELVFIYLPNTK